MDDRELLEAAAKAAGLEIRRCRLDLEWRKDILLKGGIGWNPLADDGDALRLAVKLRIDLHFEEEYVGGEWIETAEVMCLRDRETGSSHCPMHSLDDDPAATVRRLIVEAAAAIHKAQSKGETE